MWLTPRQLEKYQDVLEKLLAEMLQDTPDGTVRRLISALGILPFPPLTSSSSRRYLYSSEGFLCHVCSLYRVLRYPTRSHVLALLLGRLFTLLGCCLCPRADRDCWQHCNTSQQLSLALLPTSLLLLSKSSSLQGAISNRAYNTSYTCEAAQQLQSDLNTLLPAQGLNTNT